MKNRMTFHAPAWVGRFFFKRWLFIAVCLVLLSAHRSVLCSENTESRVLRIVSPKKAPDDITTAGTSKPDKVEFVRDKSGKEIIRITGQKDPLFYNQTNTDYLQNLKLRALQIEALRKSTTKQGRYPQDRIAFKPFAMIRIPEVSITVRVIQENDKHYDEISSSNFIIQIEENQELGIKAARMLEGFLLLFLQQMPELKSDPEKIGRLRVRLLKNSADYKILAEKAGAAGSAGVNQTRLKFHQPSKNYVSFLQNEIITSWDHGEATFFPLLFHETTHQLLHALVKKNFPVWLTEGLAEYFETTVFDDERLYLLESYWNPMAYAVEPFLNAGGNPKEIFSWTDYEGPNVSAYYGLSGAFLWYLMRNQEYRPLVTDCFKRLQNATSADLLYQEVFGKMKDPFWTGWKELILSAQ